MSILINKTFILKMLPKRIVLLFRIIIQQRKESF